MLYGHDLSKSRPGIAGLKGELKEKPMRWNLCGVTLPALAMVLTIPVAAAQPNNTNLYVQCSFYPQGENCDQAYQQALRDDSPAAASVRDAFHYYARYLKRGSVGLTDDDKRYLSQNEIWPPFDFDPADTAGLHYVINDPSLIQKSDERRSAVNAFIARAVQAELYCGTNQCAGSDTSAN
jgi:hypothetical protein